MTWPLGAEPNPIAGRYELTAPVGSGGMGTVWEGFDTVLDRPVAVKLVHRDLLGDDPGNEFLRRFRREARILARLHHPGIPDVYDLGVTDTDGAYLVMRYVPGETVADLAAECAPLPGGWVAAIGAQLAGVLAVLHRQGLLHRDIKPGNLILTATGRLVLCDFGIAAAIDSGEFSRITRSGESPGTTGYRAPEVAQGASATAVSDLWAAGTVLAELSDDADGPVARLIAELTDPAPDRRPRSAAEVSTRLAALVPGDLPDIPGFTDHHTVTDLLRQYPTRRPTGDVKPRGGFGPATEPVPTLRRRVEYLLAEDRPAQAIPLLEKAIAAGPDGVDTLSLRYDLARGREAVGDLPRAIDGYHATAEAARRLLGPDHPLAVRCRAAADRLDPAGA